MRRVLHRSVALSLRVIVAACWLHLLLVALRLRLVAGWGSLRVTLGISRRASVDLIVLRWRRAAHVILLHVYLSLAVLLLLGHNHHWVLLVENLGLVVATTAHHHLMLLLRRHLALSVVLWVIIIVALAGIFVDHQPNSETSNEGIIVLRVICS